MDIEIELKPHVGVMNTQIGRQEIELDQWMVFANGTLVGYLGKNQGSPFNIICTLPSKTREDLTKAVLGAANLKWEEAEKELQTSMAPAIEGSKEGSGE